MKKCSTSVVKKVMQIKTLKFYLIPVRMVIIKGNKNKHWQGCGEAGTLIHFWWICKLELPLWKAVCRFLIKLKIELPYDPLIPGHLPKGM
jgi:hypothetical protein